MGNAQDIERLALSQDAMTDRGYIRQIPHRIITFRIVPPFRDSEQCAGCVEIPHLYVRLFPSLSGRAWLAAWQGEARILYKKAKAPTAAGAFWFGAVTPTTGELSSREGGVSQRRVWYYYYHASTPPPSCLRWQDWRGAWGHNCAARLPRLWHRPQPMSINLSARRPTSRAVQGFCRRQPALLD